MNVSQIRASEGDTESWEADFWDHFCEEYRGTIVWLHNVFWATSHIESARFYQSSTPEGSSDGWPGVPRVHTFFWTFQNFQIWKIFWKMLMIFFQILSIAATYRNGMTFYLQIVVQAPSAPGNLEKNIKNLEIKFPDFPEIFDFQNFQIWKKLSR